MEDANFNSALEQIITDEIPRLRDALKYGDLQEKFDAAWEVVKLKQYARPLVHIFVEAFLHGESWATTHSLMELLKATGDSSIVNALQESRRLYKLGIWDKMICFRHGACELEEELIEYVYRGRRRPDTPGRQQIVNLLGEFGGRESLRIMTTLLADLGEVHAPICEEQNSTDGSPLNDVERQVQVAFRDEVRCARQRLRERGVDQPQ